METTKGPLVEYLSPSSMAAYLTNPMYFKTRYILKQYDRTTSVTALVGTAGHKALERIFTGMSVDDAILDGQRLIDNKPDHEIKYNIQIDSREKLIAKYNQAINFYVSEMPKYHHVVSVEEPIQTEVASVISPEVNLPLPISTKLDLLTANVAKELEIIDHKFVYNYTNADGDNFKRWLQAMCYHYAVKARYGIAPKRMRFNECKTSANRDGSAQIKVWTMEYDRPDDFLLFERLFGDILLDMNNPGRLFLPNPSDTFNGDSSFDLYRNEVVSVDAPLSIKHRTEEAEFVERHFVASAGDNAATANYSPEERIRKKLQEFAVAVEMRDTHVGPSVTKYTMAPSRGVRMSKISSHDRDLALALEVSSVRIEAPIPGTNLVGVEVPNKMRTVIELHDKHLRHGTLQIPIGVDVMNTVLYKDIADMPHLLIAGATGAGKSVMLNVIIKVLTAQLRPDQLQMVLVDPKQVEFAPFEKLPHLAMPVVYDNRGAAKVLDDTVAEMERRYSQLRAEGVRSIKEYNAGGIRMPYRVVILDEFADLMMAAESKSDTFTLNVNSLAADIIAMSSALTNVKAHVPGIRLSREKRAEDMKLIKQLRATIAAAAETTTPPAEDSIVRIAQKARAVGIHLILATQRPSADVVTGLIKANIPTKIAFMATNKVNSQIILDQPGAEELTGRGDMLFYDPSASGLARLQGLLA